MILHHQSTAAAAASSEDNANGVQHQVMPFAKQQVQQPEDACNAGRLQLRPYQLDVINQCRQKLAAGVSKICLVAPTGSGKTVIAAEIIRSAVAKGKRVLVLAHTREIIKQTSLKLNAAGIAHGIIMATDTVRPYEPVQVASVQTYWSRVMRTKRMDPPPADLVIVDECHHIRARTWRKIIDSYPGVALIGLTATPMPVGRPWARSSFDVLVECPQVRRADRRQVSGRHPDLCAGRNRPPRRAHADRRLCRQRAWPRASTPTRWSATSSAIGSSMRPDSRRSSLPSTSRIPGTSPPNSSKPASKPSISTAAHPNRARCNPGPAGRRRHPGRRQLQGADAKASTCPMSAACVLARPTKQQGLYRQMVGRGLRPAEGKSHLVVLDHSGAIYRHGCVEDAIEWTLSPDKRAANPAHSARPVRDTDGSYQSRIVDCNGCGAKRHVRRGVSCTAAITPNGQPRPLSSRTATLPFTTARAAQPEAPAIRTSRSAGTPC